jgi:hypothetical protein
MLAVVNHSLMSVIMLNVIMPSVTLLNALAPTEHTMLWPSFSWQAKPGPSFQL